jgi:hypothetical protein
LRGVEGRKKGFWNQKDEGGDEGLCRLKREELELRKKRKKRYN